ncbi:MAG: type II toxin-antitoxin system VapB family antitoxin [Sphingomonadales bacterium]|nr:type II toxin-antitoxin system VapB family antitoxin [Sphingomonadales bacterium]
MASLYIKDPEANALAEQVARAHGMTKTQAVKLALRRELDRTATKPLRERMADFWRVHPLPAELAPIPDKAFYDELSGDL